MTDPTELTEPAVASLIRNYIQDELQASIPAACPGHESIAWILSGEADTAEQTAADAHVKSCSLCRQDVLNYLSVCDEPQPITPRVSSPPTFSSSLVLNFIKTRTGYIAPVALAATIALGILVNAPDPESLATGATSSTPAVLISKGPQDQLHIGVKRGLREFTLKPGQATADGDQLGFFYSASQSGHLIVLTANDSGTVTQLYPASQSATAPIQPGKQVRIPDGAEVSTGTGCEWIIGAFFDRAASASSARQALLLAARQAEPDHCTLTLEVPQARTLSIHRVSP